MTELISPEKLQDFFENDMPFTAPEMRIPKLIEKLNLGYFNADKKPLLPIDPPEFNRPVMAILKGEINGAWATKIRELIALDKSDALWFFNDDLNQEVSSNWDVIYWEYHEDT